MLNQATRGRCRLFHLPEQTLVESHVADTALHQRCQAGFTASRKSDATTACDLLGGAADVAAQHRSAIEERLLDHHRGILPPDRGDDRPIRFRHQRFDVGLAVAAPQHHPVFHLLVEELEFLLKLLGLVLEVGAMDVDREVGDALLLQQIRRLQQHQRPLVEIELAEVGEAVEIAGVGLLVAGPALLGEVGRQAVFQHVEAGMVYAAVTVALNQKVTRADQRITAFEDSAYVVMPQKHVLGAPLWEAHRTGQGRGPFAQLQLMSGDHLAVVHA